MTDREMLAPINLVADARRSILLALKNAGHATIPQLAAMLSVSTEAIRQQLPQLQKEGWIASDCGPGDDGEGRSPGRPPANYCLSPIGEELFPKRYAELTSALFDQLSDVEETMATLTDERVETLTPAQREDTLAQRLQALRSIYIAGDPYTDVEATADGYRLVERNCPYLQFAMERPLFCSGTVSAIRRITGREVVREERFQDGDGKCVFHVYEDAVLRGTRKSRRFEREPPKDARPLKGA